MKKVIAFDVYGTLINTQGVLIILEGMLKDKALLFSDTWRSKQLEYSFRRGLMKRYERFSICTQEALNYTCDVLKIDLTDEQKGQLLSSYETLPAFGDVEKGLSELHQKYQLIAFSNGERTTVEGLLDRANIGMYFTDIVSAEEIQTFKPSPDVYQHLLNRIGARFDQTWLVSSNPFDVIGAKSFGLNAVWVKRSNTAIFDPWGIEPDAVINGLDDLIKEID